MEVPHYKWAAKAIKNVDRYLHRGGDSQGDTPQLLEGVNLCNTIGIVMGLDWTNPSDWSEDDMELAKKGKKNYFSGASLDQINNIAKKMLEVCGGKKEIFVTVLPIELFIEGKLYEVPLFRVQRYLYSPSRYIDNLGCAYRTFSDWKRFNKLPPTEMIYPGRLKLKKRPRYDYSVCHSTWTPAQKATGTNLSAAVDKDIVVGGLGPALVWSVLAGNARISPRARISYPKPNSEGMEKTAKELVESSRDVVESKEFTIHSIWNFFSIDPNRLEDFHADEYNPPHVRISRKEMCGHTLSRAIKLHINSSATATKIDLNSTLHVILYLIQSWRDMTENELLWHVLHFAFWIKGSYEIQTVNNLTGSAINTGFDLINNELNLDEKNKLLKIRYKLRNDELLLKKYVEALWRLCSVREFTESLVIASKNGSLQINQNDELILDGTPPHRCGIV